MKLTNMKLSNPSAALVSAEHAYVAASVASVVEAMFLDKDFGEVESERNEDGARYTCRVLLRTKWGEFWMRIDPAEGSDECVEALLELRERLT